MTAPRPETRAAQALHATEADGAVVPSITPSTTFARDASYALPAGRDYARDRSAAYPLVEGLLASLEGGAAALVFASGMAAATAVFQTLAPGDHVVAPRAMYWGLRGWLVEFCDRWGLALDLVDADQAAYARALRPGATRLVWMETPANPTWEVVDIAAVVASAHAAGARVAVDSTVATPALTRPIEIGADLVMHSATKYLNGHGDVLAGALVTRAVDPAWERIAKHRHDAGAVLGPFEAWLLLRGMRTLFVRVERQCATALAIARALDGHPNVIEVMYPGLPGARGHAAAARQMHGGFGGMLSIRVRGGAEAALAVASRLRVFYRATSLGGVESLVEHRATIEGPTSPVPPDLLRLSIGLEDAGDLIDDLRAALA